MYLSKEPILVTVTNSALHGTQGIIFLQVRVNDTWYPFRMEERVGDMTFNVQSAFNAEWLKQEMVNPISPANLSYTHISVAYYKYRYEFVNSEGEWDTSGDSILYEIADVYRGGRPQTQIMLHPEQMPSNFSYRPSSDEIVNVGDIRIMPTSQTASQKTIITNNTSITGVYIDDNPFRVNIAFINSFGLVETVSAQTRGVKSYGNEKKEYRMTGKPLGFDRFGMSQQTNGRAKWKLTSGYNTDEWIEFWITEVLKSSKHWMQLGVGTEAEWLPVTISTSNECVVYDNTKPDLASIDFEVRAIASGKV